MPVLQGNYLVQVLIFIARFAHNNAVGRSEYSNMVRFEHGLRISDSADARQSEAMLQNGNFPAAIWLQPRNWLVTPTSGAPFTYMD